MPLNLLYTHGSMRIDDYNQSATTVDPRQLRLALEDMLVEAGKPAAGQTETYFRLDAQNLTLVFHPDPSRQATGDVPGFVWGHVVRAIQVFSKDVRERPDFGRSYVGRVQDAQSKVLASIAIMPAFIQLPGHEPSGQAEEGAPKEQQVEDPDGGGVGRRPLMFAGRQVAAATGWMRVVNTGFWMSWAERSGRLAHYHIVREVIRTADQFVSYTPSDYIYNLRAHWSDIVLAIDCREGLARATARAFLDALARLLDSLMRRRLAEMNRAGDFPLQAMVIMEAVSGMVLRRGTAVAYWSIQFLGPRGRVGPNFVRGRNEL
ncbi:MAG: hypothetical protein M1832_005798 [Thelocarpon impressellum]|nr:MAG: hypothetical protein M1832_005798 [Thelocarpon impressellum]